MSKITEKHRKKKNQTEVDRDLYWISRNAFNVSLIRECQGW